MMALADTNVILRLQDPAHLQHAAAMTAVAFLRSHLVELVIFPQVVAEFWHVCTGTGDNNYKMSLQDAERRLHIVEQAFEVLPEKPEAYGIWRSLLMTPGVRGRQVFDARLAAQMLSHEVTHILTFNDRDFRRYGDIVIIDPNSPAI